MSGTIGFILLLTSIVALGVFIAIYGIMTERKEKSLLFVLSLPISTTQYTAAKVASSLIAFLIPWLVLTVTIVVLTLALDEPLDGRLPFTVTMMFFFLANFCVLIAVLLISGTEVWAVVGVVFTNVLVSVYLTTVQQLAGHRRTRRRADRRVEPHDSYDSRRRGRRDRAVSRPHVLRSIQKERLRLRSPNLMNTQDRFHALDAARAFALLLGIVLHATM